jgi:hypothetical protein
LISVTLNNLKDEPGTALFAELLTKSRDTLEELSISTSGYFPVWGLKGSQKLRILKLAYAKTYYRATERTELS